MPFQISPGVNVSEIDLTTVVPAVSTTEGALAGHFRWGPVQQRVLINSEDTLVSNFSTPNANTATDFFTAANFLSYGNKLYVVRVVDSITDSETARNAHAGVGGDVTVNNDDDYEDSYSGGIVDVGGWVARYPGDLGNSLKVSVCPSASAWQSTLTGTIDVIQDTTGLVGANTVFMTELAVGDIMILGPDHEIHTVASVTSDTEATLEDVYAGETVADNVDTVRRWEYFNYFDNAPGTTNYAATRGGSNDEMHVAVVDESGEWTKAKGTVIERFSAVSMASDAKTEDGGASYYKAVINQQSQYIRWAEHDASNVLAGSLAAATFVGDVMPQTVSLSHGKDGSMPTNADYIVGYDKFASAEDVDVSLVLGGAANQTIAVHLVNNIAESRRDCIVCISPPRSAVVNNSTYAGKEAEDVIAFRNTLPSSSYAVLDSGWKMQYDKYNDVNRNVPLNGDTAGLMVRTDNTRDPWYSPAGFNRGNVKNVIKLAYNPPKAHRDQLYKKGVNPVVSFPGQGTVLFGDKTMLSKPSAFDRINVRRLFIVLEKAIARASQFTLFEFNDEFTRAQFKNMVEPFLRDVQGRRGITDFRVICDDTNNTGEVIDRNEFVGDIYIKPARSINFITLNFVATRTGIDFEEVVGKF